MSARWGARALLRRWGPPLILLVALVLLWEIGARLDQERAWLLPPPSAIPGAVAGDAADLVRHTLVTMQEVLLGLAVSTLVGVLTAVAIAFFPLLERALYPLVVASQTVPIPALAPLLLIWLGYGLAPKVLVTALVAFFPIVVNTVDGLRATDREVLALLRTRGAGRWARFRLARLPSALPFVFSGAKVAVAVSVIGAVFGELVASKAGLGYLLVRATAQFQTARVFAAVVLLSVIGVGLFVLVALLERRLLPWRRWMLEERAS